MKLSQIWQYPLKSGRGNRCEAATVTPIGLAEDRRLLAVDADARAGLFLTARATPALLFLETQVTPQGWQITDTRNSDSIEIDIAACSETRPGKIWQDDVSALDGGDAAAAWLSEKLSHTCRMLVWQPSARQSGKYTLETSFADAAPILLMSQASVNQVCKWANLETDVRRFRPNLLLDGDKLAAFEEEKWKRIQIGEVILELLDSCTRCILTTRDPDTGEAHAEKQPLRANRENHSNDKGHPIIGMNAKLAADSPSGILRVGDTITVLESA